MGALLLVAFLVVPIVELAVILQVGSSIGVLPTVALLLVVSVLGAALVRREGARTWRAFSSAVASGRAPAREVADGALVLLGGALLLTPGFVTDIVGLVAILPPTRAVARRALTRVVARRMTAAVLRGPLRGPFPGRPGQPSGPPPGRGTGRVVEGEVVDRPEPRGESSP